MQCFSAVLVSFLATCRIVVSENDTDENPVKYDNHTLYQIVPENEIQLQLLSTFIDPDGHVEVLKPTHGLNDSTDLLVPPEKLAFLQNYVNANNMTLLLKSKQYGRQLEIVNREPRRRNGDGGFDLFSYHSHAGIENFLVDVKKKHPDLVELEYLGKSYQGRPMTLIKISANKQNTNPVIFIDAGIHAREWLAPALAIYIINRLLSDPEARSRELDGVDWYILPMVNPDGYEFSMRSSSNRLWRKTRSRTSVPGCYGVDGNRNYGFKWGVSGVSNNPCHKETYPGPAAFSEPETRYVRHVVVSNKGRIKLYVSLHAYGQYIVYPWGYTGDSLPASWKDLDKLARKVSDAVVRAGGEPFTVMSAGKWYAAAGGSDDFSFSTGVPYAYTMELSKGYEFTFPESRLRKSLPLYYEGFVEFGRNIKQEFSN